jgi:hypothetical protein
LGRLGGDHNAIGAAKARQQLGYVFVEFNAKNAVSFR